MSVRLDSIGIFDWSETLWMERAGCARADPDLFFPGPSRRAHFKVNEAKAICAMCSVRAQCLDWAIATEQRCGVWGGLDEDELRRVRRQARRELIGTNGRPPLRLVEAAPLGPER